MAQRGTVAVSTMLQQTFGRDLNYMTPRYLKDHQYKHIHQQDPRNINYTETRRTAFRDLMRKAKLPNPDVLGDELLEIYLAARDERYEFYDGVHETLEYLARRYPLAWITNGHTTPERAGLQDYFSVTIMPHTLGVRKPHQRVFEYAAKKLHGRLENMLHVGDNMFTDVGGIIEAGGTGIWFNPHGRRNRTQYMPYAEIEVMPEVMMHLI